MFILVGLGLGDEADITVRGLEATKKADIVFLESYTSFLIHCNVESLKAFLGKDVIVADREAVESGEVLLLAKEKIVVLLVAGDVFGATTHSDLVVRCKQLGIPCSVIHNASIVNVVGCCGLQLYRFGQVLSLCFFTPTWQPDSWYEKFLSNRKAGIHTLFLLDIKVKEVSNENLARNRKIFEPPHYMTVHEAVQQIFTVEQRRGGGAISTTTPLVGLARIGSRTQKIVLGTATELERVDFGPPLHSLIVPGEIHECEMDLLSYFRCEYSNSCFILCLS